MVGEKHTNRLINETSPYLLQHAHNPVDWYPWGDEAFTKARGENKPVLLSIGYSACHWCHVMEHESFEDEAIAQLMNEHFVNIKVDREERPDLDQIYMNAVQMLTHHGGWPMTVFLTPEGVPFYGGTYFPPEDRYNMPGFPRVLEGVAAAYRDRPDDVKQTAASVLEGLRSFGAMRESQELLTADVLQSARKGIAQSYDPNNGGFGGAPKFPPAMTLEFLLRQHYRNGDNEALQMVRHTCLKMAEGGIYDQLGGGFHRYSTDSKWLVPHFEKMLYDNALLSRLYLHLYQLTGEEFARRTAMGVLDYVAREMTDERGGFYSTQDADSEGHEGKFFVWSVEEIERVLGAEDASLFNAYYNVTPAGNFEGQNIPNVTRSVDDVAKQENVSSEHLREALTRGVAKLFAVREKRIKPARDEKVLTAWNGLMLASFAEAGAILEREDYTEIARRNASFLQDNLKRDGLLLRTYKDGVAKLNAYLEDYAYLAEGLLTLYETTGEAAWFKQAREITDKMISEFWDDADGGFFYVGSSHEELIVRSKDYYDNATPSGNSVAADLLLRLSVLTDNNDYRNRAVTIFRQVEELLRRLPSAFGRMLCALDFYLGAPKELVIVGEPDLQETQALVREVWSNYLPNKVVVQLSSENGETGSLIPLSRNRSLVDGKPTAYVCEHYTCKEPATNPERLRQQLLE